jgi:hypothetical protein
MRILRLSALLLMPWSLFGAQRTDAQALAVSGTEQMAISCTLAIGSLTPADGPVVQAFGLAGIFIKRKTDDIAPSSQATDKSAAGHAEQAGADPAKAIRAAAPQAHRFRDKQNAWLFAGVAASRALDYFSTLNMRQRGRQEILLTNDLVDNHAAFAAVEAAGTGASMAASYLFHRYRHHALERWTSYIHIGLATSGAVRNYCLKTAHGGPMATHP